MLYTTLAGLLRPLRGSGVRRPLGVLALGLMLLGVEVATGAVSLGAARLSSGLAAALSGDEFLIPRPRYLSGLAILCLGIGVLGAVLWAEGVRETVLRDGSACPRCGKHTKRVRRRV